MAFLLDHVFFASSHGDSTHTCFYRASPSDLKRTVQHSYPSSRSKDSILFFGNALLVPLSGSWTAQVICVSRSRATSITILAWSSEPGKQLSKAISGTPRSLAGQRRWSAVVPLPLGHTCVTASVSSRGWVPLDHSSSSVAWPLLTPPASR